ncbi:hypothetical protein C8Q75DRAFT_802551 [Abortiporus biennis]|nr:hypothetical protein C8Q75DRAFT_802551 [Abortiporus biennis]
MPMSLFSAQKESILLELVLQLIYAKQYRKALDELQLYLSSPPFDDNATLHVYAGLVSLYLAQPPPTNGEDFAGK